MLDTVAKNLWLMLTLVIPGLFTYGAWRFLLLLDPGTGLETSSLKQIDESAFASASIIIAIALLQQSIAIAIESGLEKLAKLRKEKWPDFHTLLHERFELAATGKLDEDATRIIGNFFLSINMSVGLALLLLYFMAFAGMCILQWVPLSIIFMLAATLVTTVFRASNAKCAIVACKNKET